MTKHSYKHRSRSSSEDKKHYSKKEYKSSKSRQRSRSNSPKQSRYKGSSSKYRSPSPSSKFTDKKSRHSRYDSRSPSNEKFKSKHRPRYSSRSCSPKYEKQSRHKSISPSSKYNKDKSRIKSNKPSDKSRERSASNSSSEDNSYSHSTYHSKHKSKKDKKKKKKKSKSSSSEESSDNEAKLLLQLEHERVRKKQEKILNKEILKTTEAPEEKRLRRLLKKEAKERKRKEKMGWDSEYLHFTNADNPYGDNNLLDTFVWRKKLEKDGLTDLSREDIEKQNRQKMEENRQELEKVKKRRHEREMERAEREKLMELEQRQREAAQFSEFSRQEDNFQLEQARIRSQIRIQDERAKPIDLLAQYVSSEGDVTAVDMHEPYTHLTGLTLQDLEDLLEDIKVYQQLDLEDENQSYWFDLTVIVQDELRRLRQRDKLAIEDATTHRQGIHSSVASDVSKIFQNKSVADLIKLQKSIETKLSGPTTGIDIGYWESLLSQLKAHQARARLRERHRENLRKKLEMLKAEQGVVEISQPEIESQVQVSQSNSPTSVSQDENIDDDVEEASEEHSETEDFISTALTSYKSGRFSPKLIRLESLEPGTVVVDEMEDEQRLAWARRRLVGAGQAVENVLTAEEKAMQREAQQAMSNEEAQFSVEAKLDPQHYLWSDKYRPRKPRYFNRVHTGFEWNKYNQTHYDMDNPPPKIVQGYKFNIFYPDLIEKARTPQYELIPCDDNKDFALLKFVAGPPYEDIAFKIVNREWEYSYKRGFRCQFHNNIFQLWFHFKRYRYRR